jgi:flagellar biosynthesis protein FlhB
MAEKKTYDATPRKLKKARKEGKVLKSQLLTGSAVVSSVLLTALLTIRLTWVKNRMLLESIIVYGAAEPELWIAQMAWRGLFVIFTSLAAGVVTAILVEIAQAGLAIEPAVLSPRFERLNPTKGLSKIAAGIKSSWLPVLNCCVFAVVLAVFGATLYRKLPAAFFLPQELSHVLLMGMVWQLVGVVVLALIILGGVEFLVKRREFLAELSMSHQEMKEENKDTEGDPYLKGARKSLHEDILTDDMVRRVKESRVVVVEK